MPNFKIIENDEEISLADRVNDYVLCAGNNHSLGNVYFLTGTLTRCGLFRDTKIPITGRSFEEYRKEIKSLPINETLQYLEVGAGLGEFIPGLVQRLNMIRKPIAVELANYQIMEKMLKYAVKNLPLDEELNGKMLSFLERIDVLHNPNKVILFNMRLSEFVERNPHLHGCADVLIDLAGPIIYSETEFIPNDKGIGMKRKLDERVEKLKSTLRK